MEILELIRQSVNQGQSQPIFLNDWQQPNADQIEILKKENQILSIVDIYSLQVNELKTVIPEIDFFSITPIWVYLPWKKTLAKIVPEIFFNALRTYRNKLLITNHEQEIFYNFKIGLVGLSVGNSIAASIVTHGGGRFMKIADPDILMPTNLNRVRTSFLNTGISKIDIILREIYEINPYSKVEAFDGGINSENIMNFFSENKKIDICVDEVDDFHLKINLRLWAKKNHLPVIMATDHEDSVIIDVERYDVDPNYPLFHGIFSEHELDNILKKNLDLEDFKEIGKKFIGQSNFSSKMMNSLNELGKKIKSVPQLSTATLAAGPIVSKFVRDIALKTDHRSFRKIIEY